MHLSVSITETKFYITVSLRFLIGAHIEPDIASVVITLKPLVRTETGYVIMNIKLLLFLRVIRIIVLVQGFIRSSDICINIVLSIPFEPRI